MKNSWLVIFLFLFLAGILATAFLFGEPPSLVAWKPLRPLAIESDDWGLAGFVPDERAWDGLDKGQLDTGHFPGIYWLSTLEDSSMVGALDRVLARHIGRDGLPAVLQPNYVMSSLGYVGGKWKAYDLPSVPPEYERPGLWEAVEAAVRRGTWYPEFHAAWHYDPDRRKSEGLGGEFARRITERGIMLFPGSERAWELGAWRPLEDLENELDNSLSVFATLFHRPPVSVMAPDYHWDGRIEDMWSDRGLRIIQGKREQINPAWGQGKPARLRKYLARHWDRLSRPGSVYLERNCLLEPAQSEDPGKVVTTCVDQTLRAWSRNQPAIVESHRVNFAHTDPRVVAGGLGALDRYLAEICRNPETKPIFVTDQELAQLTRLGVSWCVRGPRIIVRNGTHGRKMVVLPADARNQALAAAGRDPSARGPLILALEGGAQVEFVP